MKNFDGHIIISEIDQSLVKDKIKIIPHSAEKYIAFWIDDLKFLDSFSFLPSSLDNLSSNLSVEQKDKFLRQLFPNDTSLLLKKACLPYEYLTDFDKFNDDLPDKSHFYSSLSESEVDQEVYDHVKSVWSNFKCKNLKDLHDIYLKVDVLLLAAVFENFRETSMTAFNIDPLHHFSSPGLTWAASLKKNKGLT